MAFTFLVEQIDPATGTSPSNVRWLIQDTDPAAAEFSDEEIAAVRAMRPASETDAVKTYRTAAQLAAAKARYYGRIGNFSSGGTTVDVDAIRKGWERIAEKCAAMADYEESGSALMVIQGSREPNWPY